METTGKFAKLRCAAWFEEAREVAAFAQLRDLQRDPACPGIPVAVAVSVVLPV